MKPRRRALSYGKKPANARLPSRVRLHPAHRVMSCGADWNRFFSQIKPPLQALRKNFGKPFFQKRPPERAAVQKNLSLARFLENHSRHHMPRRKLSANVVFSCESLAFFVDEQSSFS